MTLDPEIKCYLPGVPRANYMPYPFQIIQSSKYIMMIYTFAGAVRTVYMDEHKEAPADSWMGWSNGRWDGETLVVDTTGFNGRTWLDRAGNFHSDQLHVVERFTAGSRDHLLYEATIEDPKVFTRPWKISMPLYRRLDRNAQIMEFKCVLFHIDVKGPDGRVETWMVEGGSPNQLIRLGVTKNSLQIGTELVIQG